MFNADGSESQDVRAMAYDVLPICYDHGQGAQANTEFSVPGMATMPHALRIETGGVF
jgi:hypothetical protein